MCVAIPDSLDQLAAVWPLPTPEFVQEAVCRVVDQAHVFDPSHLARRREHLRRRKSRPLRG
jgi:hypothetical protein